MLLTLIFAAGCTAISETIADAGCKVAHSKGVDWTNRPKIGADRVMRVSGILKEGYTLSGGGGAPAPFNFNNHREQEGVVVRKLQALGTIGPNGPYGAIKYAIGPGPNQSFDLEVRVSERLESDNKLVFVVWGGELNEQERVDAWDDIGAACVKGP